MDENWGYPYFRKPPFILSRFYGVTGVCCKYYVATSFQSFFAKKRAADDRDNPNANRQFIDHFQTI